jgi:Tol biopolymer transport system component
MKLVSKLALAAVVTLPLVACGGAPDAEPGAAPAVDTSHVAPAGCGLFCIPLYTDKIAYSEWWQWQIHVRDTYYATDVTLPLTGRHPILSPDQTKVAYVGASDGNIYVASATDGSGKIALTTTGGFDTPSWSPDGSTVVFASAGSAGYGANIYRAPATGGQGLWQITANPGTWYFEPRFLNATTIVFQVGLTGQASFGLVPSTAAYDASITYLNVSGQLGDIVVSPDGTKVAFTKTNGSCGREAIALGTLSGTTVSNLHELYCNGSGDSSKPSIGVGNMVGFVFQSGGYGTSYVYTINSAGLGLTYQSITTPSTPPDANLR